MTGKWVETMLEKAKKMSRKPRKWLEFEPGFGVVILNKVCKQLIANDRNAR